jgi:hypothetical protein
MVFLVHPHCIGGNLELLGFWLSAIFELIQKLFLIV